MILLPLLASIPVSAASTPPLDLGHPSSTSQSPAEAKPAPSPARSFRNAVLISVDGLRSDALIAVPRTELPAFARMIGCASTLNARTDPDFTVTLPNHTAMLTGRLVLGEAGHAWIENDDPPDGATLHENKAAYVPGIFDVAHDRGFKTACFAGKTKFSLYDDSWDGAHGAPDVEGPDQGRDKIDEFDVFGGVEEIPDAVLRALKANAASGSQGSLVFAHFAATDHAGHESGWDLTPGSKYMRAVRAVDRELGRLLDAVEADPSLRGRTAVVLTADHGGGAPFRSHDRSDMWVDYIIPFLAWTGDGEPPRDLYAINGATRRDPGLRQIASSAEEQPIRNGDAGNFVLDLLGLPAVPGSTVNAKQDLEVFAPR